VHAGTDTFPRCCANVTAYDALNVALAEALDAPLVTCDARLTRRLRRSRCCAVARWVSTYARRYDR